MTVRRFTEPKLVLASHNPGKLCEIQALLNPHAVEVASAGAFGLRLPDETGATFEANALLKATAVVAATGLPALSDDSGFSIAGLNGAPGVYSADWAGPEEDYVGAIARILEELGPDGDRQAAFMCCLCLAWPDGRHEFVMGRVEGAFVFPARGVGGFGYDPVFQPAGDTRTFGEMPFEEKQGLSHRGRAIQALLARHFA